MIYSIIIYNIIQYDIVYMCLEFGGFEPLYAQTCDDGVVPTVMMIFLRLLDMANGTEGQLLIIGGAPF